MGQTTKHEQNRTTVAKKEMLAALEKSLGVVTIALNATGTGRATYYQWLKDDEDFKQQVDDISEIALDFAESQLHKQIKDGEVSSTIFYLKTKGKKRGYIEKVQTELSGQVEIGVTFNGETKDLKTSE